RLLVELLDFLPRVPQLAAVDRDERDPVYGEPQVRALRRQHAARQQRRDDEQDGGERHLPGDQRVAERPAPAPGLGRLLLAAQLGDEVRLGRQDRRYEAGDQRREQRDGERERQHTQIDAQVEREGNRRRQADRAGD